MWKPKKLYSQNFEDLYLWRVFNEKIKGFYIDVGAQEHEADSVTKIFYDQGWTGINIEPSPSLFKELKKNRENDINLSVAAFNKSSIQKFNKYGSSGLGSLKSVHEVNIQDYILREKEVIEVQTATLYEIINTYCNYPNIDFLKIDVEGSEKEVIQGIKFEKLDKNKHPRIIVVEVNSPNSRLISSQQSDCQKLLAKAEYSCFFFDGLNEYYCKNEDKKNLERITLPPNVFDEIVLTPSGVSGEIKNISQKLKEHIELCNEKESEKKELRDQNTKVTQELEELRDQNTKLSQTLEEHIELCNEKESEKKELRDQNTKLSQTLEEHIELCNEKEAEIKELRDQNTKLSQMLEEHIELCNEKEAEKKELRDQNKILSQKLKEHIKLCNEKEAEKKELIDQNKKVTQEFEELREQNKKVTQEFEELRDQNKKVTQEFEELIDQNKILSQKLKEHIKLCNEKEVEKKELIDQNKKVTQELEKLIIQFNLKEKEIFNLQKDKDLLLSQLHIVQSELELYFLKYTAANVLISTLRSEYDKSIDTISRLIKVNNSNFRLFRKNKLKVFEASIKDK